jgi:hypothetical protein
MGRMLVSLSLATVSLALAVSCASKTKKKTLPEILAHKGEPKADYVAISFDKGNSKLDEADKASIKELLQHVSFTKVRILSWADKEYPDNSHMKARAPEILLAEDRSQEVENYLRKELKPQLRIETFNMAKRPGNLEKLFKTSDYQMKESFEQSGTTGIELEDGTLSYTKASKAIIIIDQDQGGSL